MIIHYIESTTSGNFDEKKIRKKEEQCFSLKFSLFLRFIKGKTGCKAAGESVSIQNRDYKQP